MEKAEKLKPLFFLIVTCQVMMGIGFALCPESMLGGTINTLTGKLGWLLSRTGGAVGFHLPLVLAAGIPLCLDEKHGISAALTSLVLYLIFTDLSSIHTMRILFPSFFAADLHVTALQDSESWLCAFLIAALAMKVNASIPEYRDARKFIRWMLLTMSAGVVFTFVYLLFFLPSWKGIYVLGTRLAHGKAAEAGIVSGLMRLLKPLNLDLPLREALWLKQYGLGDWNAFYERHMPGEDPWSIGIYMSGILPCMITGVPASACVIHGKGLMKNHVLFVLMVFAAFLCGASDVFELCMLAVSPLLFLPYSLLFSFMGWITALTPFRAAVGFAGGFSDFLVSQTYPAAQGPLWLILLCIVSAGLFSACTAWILKKESGRENRSFLSGKDDR